MGCRQTELIKYDWKQLLYKSEAAQSERMSYWTDRVLAAEATKASRDTPSDPQVFIPIANG